jgi:hypothetical protein
LHGATLRLSPAAYKRERGRERAATLGSRMPTPTRAALSLVLASTSACAAGSHDVIDDRAALPELPYCDAVRDWPDALVDREAEMLALIEATREHGRDCGDGGSFGGTMAARTTGALVCAARAHALDMATRGFFEHANPDGELVWDRLALADYPTHDATELILAGEAATDVVLDAWLRRGPSCADLLAPEHVDIGVGYAGDVLAAQSEWGAYWTVVLARPAAED